MTRSGPSPAGLTSGPTSGPRAGLTSWSAAGGLFLAVLTRPQLWRSAIGTLGRTARPRWWRHRPFLPLPDPDWWSFRMVTAYGRPDAEPRARDVVSYLEWCRSTGAHRQSG